MRWCFHYVTHEDSKQRVGAKYFFEYIYTVTTETVLFVLDLYLVYHFNILQSSLILWNSTWLVKRAPFLHILVRRLARMTYHLWTEQMKSMRYVTSQNIQSFCVFLLREPFHALGSDTESSKVMIASQCCLWLIHTPAKTTLPQPKCPSTDNPASFSQPSKHSSFRSSKQLMRMHWQSILVTALQSPEEDQEQLWSNTTSQKS